MKIPKPPRTRPIWRKKITSTLAIAGLALAPVLITAPANAITCPPGFEMLPGCTNNGSGGGSNNGGGATTPGTWATETIAGMSVRLYTPSAPAKFEAGRALMVSLHGCAQKANDFQLNANWVAAAEEYGMIIALPDAPNGGVILGCWDYYDSNHSRSNPSRHDDNILDLVAELKSRSALEIDTNQIYISGLSSGGGQTMVMGCLAPDIFAGIGINAGPTVGTTSGQISSVAVSKSQGTATCNNFAASAKPAFATQLTSVIFGSTDNTVAQGYGTLNGQIMAGIYEATQTSTFALTGIAGNNTAGSGTLYSDANGPRVSVITNTGLGHAWPAGAGSGGTYISANSIDYPSYLSAFFFDNNRRMDRTPGSEPPIIDPPVTDPPEIDVCFTMTNAEHKTSGRAYDYGINPYNPYYAIGSQSYLGLGDSTVTSLRQVSESSFEMVPSC